MSNTQTTISYSYIQPIDAAEVERAKALGDLIGKALGTPWFAPLSRTRAIAKKIGVPRKLTA